MDKIDSLTGGRVKMYKERGHILYGKGRYRKALEMLDKASEERPDSVEVKGLKLMTLARLRQVDRVVGLFSETIRDLEKNYNESLASRLDEVRTQYEVDKYVAEKERNRNYFLAALGGCVLLALLLGVAFYYNRVVTRKNVGLYRRIKEQDRLEEELVRVTREYEALLSSDRQTDHAEVSAALPGNRAQRELVERLREYLLTGDNLSDSDTGRDAITAALGTNRNTLTEAVKAVTGKMPMEYIRSLQIEQARRLSNPTPT